MGEWSILANYLRDSFINSFPPNIFYSRNNSYEKKIHLPFSNVTGVTADSEKVEALTGLV